MSLPVVLVIQTDICIPAPHLHLQMQDSKDSQGTINTFLIWVVLLNLTLRPEIAATRAHMSISFCQPFVRLRPHPR